MAAWLESRGTTFSSVPLPAPGLSETTEGSEGTLVLRIRRQATYNVSEPLISLASIYLPCTTRDSNLPGLTHLILETTP